MLICGLILSPFLSFHEATAATGSTGIIVPAYMQPYSDTCDKLEAPFYWQSIADAELANPNVPVVVIANPSDGPGPLHDTSKIPCTVAGVDELKQGQSTLQLSVASTIIPGTYPITITGTSGSISHSTTFPLTIYSGSPPQTPWDFLLAASPVNMNGAVGSKGSGTILAFPFNIPKFGLNPVTLTVVSGLPTNMGYRFSLNPATISTLTLTAGTGGVSAGTYQITVKATAGSVTHKTSFTLTVYSGTVSNPTDFSLSVPSLAIQKPTSGSNLGSTTIYVTPAFSFSSQVTFTASNLPAGVTVSSDPPNPGTSGIKVIGYVATQYAGCGDGTHCGSNLSHVEQDIVKWTYYKNNFGFPIDGIHFDEMESKSYNTPHNCKGVSSSYDIANYYSTLTNYAETNGMPLTFGNPGIDTQDCYVGTVGTLEIYENAHDSTSPLNDQTLQGENYQGMGYNWHTIYDKKNFAFVYYDEPNPGQAQIQEWSVFVGYMYLTDDTGCWVNNIEQPYSYCKTNKLPINAYNYISNYLSSEMSFINVPSVVSTIKPQTTSGTLLDAHVQINYQSQTGPLVRDGKNQFTYTEASGWNFVLNAQPYSGYQNKVCWFENGGSTAYANPHSINPNSATTYTATYYTTSQTPPC